MQGQQKQDYQLIQKPFHWVEDNNGSVCINFTYTHAHCIHVYINKEKHIVYISNRHLDEQYAAFVTLIVFYKYIINVKKKNKRIPC